MIMVLLDTHVLYWFSSRSERLSPIATAAVEDASELAVAAITWLELAWLAKHGRILVRGPIRAWLDGLAGQVRTLGITPAIAAIAVSLPSTVPGDPADRLIYATAIEHGIGLVTKDRALRSVPQSPAIW
ncbi:MAG: type II toxin-antitoxin system VapC family toxin [Candidatus Dormibacteraceae bacterium]